MQGNKGSAAEWQRVADDQAATTFRVQGGGFIIGRIANELGIARTTGLKDVYPSAENG